MKQSVVTAASAAALGGLAYANYRRFVYKPEALGTRSYAVDTRELPVSTGGHTICGELLLPRGLGGKLPTVIISHGLNSSGPNAQNLVGRSLAMSGFAVYCFDFFGGSRHSRSGGEMAKMTVFTEQADLNAVIDRIRTLDTTDPDRLFLLGESQGGFVTAITAAQRPQDIRAVIEYYPAFCIPEDARARHGSVEQIPEWERFGASVLGRAYNESVWDYDVYSVISAYKGPVLILHGDKDKIVDISYGQRAAELYDHAEFVCLPGEVHGFTAAGRKKAARLSYEFLQRVLADNGKEEILTINAELGRSTMKQEGLYNILTVPFTGEAKSRWFQGTILPGAADVQRRRLWKTDLFRADYTLEGTDHTGQNCRIHIINEDRGQGWKPTIATDSKALAFLNGTGCDAVLQGHKNRLTVRIFAGTARPFLLGASTAAHQVEGNNIHSDCWVMENLPHSDYAEPSGMAVDHYHRYEEDIRLLREAGCNAYRFSIEWARIEPEEGRFDLLELEHYRNMLEYCHRLGVTPIVTLHHFSSPAWLISKGGWGKPYVIQAFRRYAELIARELGDLMPYVCTINEANMGYQLKKVMADMMKASQREGDVQVGVNLDAKAIVKGMFEKGHAFHCSPFGVSPFLMPRSLRQEKTVMKAHRAACESFRVLSPKTKIGLTFSLFDYQPVEGGEKKAARLWQEDFGWYLPYIRNDDFLGVQNYSRKIVDARGAREPAKDAPLTQMGYEEYPQSIGNVLRKAAQSFRGELIVTENGLATDDDSRRCAFVKQAVESVAAARADGVPVIGYCHWSLLDNFEWQAGYGKTFGLIAVDRKTQMRYPKESLKVLRSLRETVI